MAMVTPMCSLCFSATVMLSIAIHGRLTIGKSQVVSAVGTSVQEQRRRKVYTQGLHGCDVGGILLDSDLETLQIGKVAYQPLVVRECDKSAAVVESSQVAQSTCRERSLHEIREVLGVEERPGCLVVREQKRRGGDLVALEEGRRRPGRDQHGLDRPSFLRLLPCLDLAPESAVAEHLDLDFAVGAAFHHLPEAFHRRCDLVVGEIVRIEMSNGHGILGSKSRAPRRREGDGHRDKDSEDKGNGKNTCQLLRKTSAAATTKGPRR